MIIIIMIKTNIHTYIQMLGCLQFLKPRQHQFNVRGFAAGRAVEYGTKAAEQGSVKRLDAKIVKGWGIPGLIGGLVRWD